MFVAALAAQSFKGAAHRNIFLLFTRRFSQCCVVRKTITKMYMYAAGQRKMGGEEFSDATTKAEIELKGQQTKSLNHFCIVVV